MLWLADIFEIYVILLIMIWLYVYMEQLISILERVCIEIIWGHNHVSENRPFWLIFGFFLISQRNNIDCQCKYSLNKLFLAMLYLSLQTKANSRSFFFTFSFNSTHFSWITFFLSFRSLKLKIC